MDKAVKKKTEGPASAAEQETVGLHKPSEPENGASRSSDPMIGSPLGSGTVVGVLGGGGGALVYEILHRELQIKRAVKLLRPNYTPIGLELFKREIIITAQLSHPNIIMIHGAGNYNGRPYIEMERVNGRTLATILKEKGSIAVPAALAVAYYICKALGYAHNRSYYFDGKEYSGIVHGDLKPANVMITSGGTVKVMDFGIAANTYGPVETGQDGASPVVGSLSYLAPEQHAGKLFDRRADIFAFGCILYEMITGHRAVAADESLTIDSRQELKLDFSGHRVPSKLSALIGQCLRLDPDRRQPTMEAVETLIEEIHHSITLRYPDQTIERYITGGSIFTTGRERTGKLRSGVLAAILFLIPPAAAIWAGINLFHPDPGSAPGIMVDSRRIITAASHIGKLRRSSTEDLVSLYRKGANSGEYEQALMLYGLLPDSISGNDDILLLRLRCLMNMDSVAMKTLNTTRIKDAEYYLLKGRFLYRRGMFTEAVGSFDSAALFSAQLMDIGAVRRSAIAYRARSLTLIYKRNPGRESLVKAVSGWYDVKKNATDLMDPAFIESASGLTFLIRDAEARKLLVQGDTLRKAMQ